MIFVVGFSGAGKTTLIERLIPELRVRGYRVGSIKHDVHGFQMDRPGKDSWRHKEAGASATVISSPRRIGMVRDVDHDHPVEALVPLLSDMDVVLVEGYKQVKQAKLEVFRPEIHEAPLCKDDEYLVALISDTPMDLGVPRFGTEDAGALTDFLISRFRLVPSRPEQQREAVS
jgi:molybdopterin-guanine dinucleotide biosynthesis protein B